MSYSILITIAILLMAGAAVGWVAARLYCAQLVTFFSRPVRARNYIQFPIYGVVLYLLTPYTMVVLLGIIIGLDSDDRNAVLSLIHEKVRI